MELKSLGGAASTSAARGNSSAPAQGPRLGMATDVARFTRRDGDAPQQASGSTPGVKKLAIGGGIFAACTIGLGLSLAAAASAPLWVPALFGAGVLVGGGIAIKGAMEFAHYLSNKINNATNSAIQQ